LRSMRCRSSTPPRRLPPSRCWPSAGPSPSGCSRRAAGLSRSAFTSTSWRLHHQRGLPSEPDSQSRAGCVGWLGGGLGDAGAGGNSPGPERCVFQEGETTAGAQEAGRPTGCTQNPAAGRFSSCQSSDRRKRGEWHKWQKYSCGASRSARGTIVVIVSIRSIIGYSRLRHSVGHRASVAQGRVIDVRDRQWAWRGWQNTPGVRTQAKNRNTLVVYFGSLVYFCSYESSPRCSGSLNIMAGSQTPHTISASGAHSSTLPFAVIV